MKDDAARFIGMVLNNKYEIQSLMGKGSMGNVFKAMHLHMDMPVAIKILHPSLTEDETIVKRFHREARLAISIKHPNAVSVMDFGVIEKNIFYLVMELITSGSLAALIKYEPKLEIHRAVKIIKQICMGVGAAHQKHIVHRDLKPGNVLIVDSGFPNETVKVIDFSIAKSADKTENLTSKDQVIGTPEYIAPEQIEGTNIDARTDIYSMGIILYQLLTGELPFQSKVPTGLYLKHIHSKPRPPRELRPEIPVELEDVVLRALAKNPDNRPQTAAIFAEELTAAIASLNYVVSNEDGSINNIVPAGFDPLSEMDIPTRIVSVNKEPLMEVDANVDADQLKTKDAIQSAPGNIVDIVKAHTVKLPKRDEFDTPESMPAVKLEVKVASEPELKAQTAPQIKPEIRDEVKPAPQLALKSKQKPEQKSKQKSQIKSEAKSAVKSNPIISPTISKSSTSQSSTSIDLQQLNDQVQQPPLSLWKRILNFLKFWRR